MEWPNFTRAQRIGVIDAVGRGRMEEIINHLPEDQKPIIIKGMRNRQSRTVPFVVERQWKCQLRVRYIPLVGFEQISEIPCGEVCKGNDIHRHLEGHFGTARLQSWTLPRRRSVSSDGSFVWSVRPPKSHVKKVRIP